MQTEKPIEKKYELQDYLEMNSDELYDHLISFVLGQKNPDAMLTELKESERYQSSYEFRIMVDFASVLHSASVKEMDFTKQIVDCIDILERATALEMWQVVATSWNSMGALYTKMGMYEKAFECYGHAIRVESSHGLFKISPVVYGNTVIILNQMDDAEKAMEYLERGLRLLEERGESIPRYWSHYVAVNSLYLQLRLQRGQGASKEELQISFDRVMSVPDEKLNSYAMQNRLNAEFYYAFHFYDKKAFDEVLERMKDLVGQQNYILFLHQCIQLSELMGRDPNPYIQELIALDDAGIVHLPLPNTFTYDVLMKYYEKQGNKEKLNEAQIKYIQSVKQHLQELSEQQAHSMHTIEQLVMSEEFRVSNNVKNVEFKLMAEETLKIKRELEEKNAILARISSMDGLTQISSRRDFEERFHDLLEKADSEGSSVAVYMVDIDFFKKYNDTYGHLQGDEVLKRVAKVFRKQLDTVGALSARFGGEEFIGAASSLTVEKAEEIAQGICEEIYSLEIEHSASPLHFVSVSVGVAFSDRARRKFKSRLMKYADVCLYDAKNAGKNRFVLKQVELND